ncbi:hypothetical protein MHBO_001438, partial [Bonamia ostreae]
TEKLKIGKNEKIVLSGETGEISSEKLLLNGEKGGKAGDILTTGDIKTSSGNIETGGNIVSLGYIKANTLRLGLSSEVPTNSGEISSNFISVSDGGSEKIKLHGHAAKISIEDSGEEKIVLDGKTGTIKLKDGKGQKTTLSVDNILEDTTVNDLTIEGKNSFFKIQEGNAGNEDYVYIDSKAPKLKMVNRQGFSDVNSVELNSMSKGSNSAEISADETFGKFIRAKSEMAFGISRENDKGYINMKGDESEIIMDPNDMSIKMIKKSKEIKLDVEKEASINIEDSKNSISFGAGNILLFENGNDTTVIEGGVVQLSFDVQNKVNGDKMAFLNEENILLRNRNRVVTMNSSVISIGNSDIGTETKFTGEGDITNGKTFIETREEKIDVFTEKFKLKFLGGKVSFSEGSQSFDTEEGYSASFGNNTMELTSGKIKFGNENKTMKYSVDNNNLNLSEEKGEININGAEGLFIKSLERKQAITANALEGIKVFKPDSESSHLKPKGIKVF